MQLATATGTTMIPLTRPAGTVAMPLHQPALVAPKGGEDKLKKVCQQLEGVFFNMMLKEMRKTIPKDELLPDSQNQTDIFQSMMDDNTAQSMAEHDTASSGMGAMLYAQLSGKKTYAAAAAGGRLLKMGAVNASPDAVATEEIAEPTTNAVAATAEDARLRKAVR